MKNWHLQYVQKSHLDLPDATADPALAAAGDSASDDAARLQKLIPHVTDVCHNLVDPLLQSMLTCDILQASCQPLQICQEVVSLFQSSSSRALQSWANQTPANFSISTLLGSLSLQSHAYTSPIVAVSRALFTGTKYSETYHVDRLRQVISCRLLYSYAMSQGEAHLIPT